jgi:hypothetical protein
VFVSTPQALTTGIVPPDSFDVPVLTPTSAKYGALCTQLSTLSLPDSLAVTCNGDDPLTVEVLAPPAP